MKRVAWILIVCCMVLGNAAAALGAQGGLLLSAREGSDESGEELSLYAQSAVLMDGDSGRVLYGKEAKTIRPMASTTKIMTCILALEYGDMEDTVEASREAAAQPAVHLGVRAGEKYRLGNLLYALMLESYNDAAVMIAEHIGGDVKGFAERMNDKARSLGCEDTYFITPNGLDAKEEDEAGRERIHSTTAEDLARIMCYCIRRSPKREEFLEITGTQNYYFTDAEGKRSFSCYNHNALLSSMEGMLSGKTGFTGGAGYSYVGAIESRGRTFVIALLGCGWPPHKTYKWEDARKLFSYGKETYELRQVAFAGEYPSLPVLGGLYWEEGEDGRRIEVYGNTPEGAAGFTLLLGEDERVMRRVILPECLSAPVSEGQEVGWVEYLLDGEVLLRYPLLAAQEVEKMTFMRGLSHLWEMFWSLCPSVKS